jgi:hypothetical protein
VKETGAFAGKVAPRVGEQQSCDNNSLDISRDPKSGTQSRESCLSTSNLLGLPIDRVHHHADAILRASGSGLRNYSMESTKLAILSASLKFAEEMVRRGALIAQQETERATVEKIVAWLRDGADDGFLDAAGAIEAGEWRA